MILYGAQLDSQACGDRTVTQSERDVIGDLQLARGQPRAVEAMVVGKSGDSTHQPGRDNR
jgi:hypothetical protein